MEDYRRCSDVRLSPRLCWQELKVAELRIFAKNPKREAIADSYNLNRVTEVAYFAPKADIHRQHTPFCEGALFSDEK